MVRKSNISRSMSGANMHDVAMLATFFLLGVASLTFTKVFFGSNAIGNLLAVLATATSLVAYAVVSYFSNSTKIEPETIGDNCYYLGFLFTLTSLSIALFQISNLNGEVESYRQLISGFGIALSSTIIGVLLRVIFMQGRHDLVARERESRLALNEATSEFRGVLSQSIAELKQFSAETVQVSKETLDAVTEVAKQARIEHQQSIESETKKSLDAIQSKLGTTNEIIAERVQSSLERLSSAAAGDMKRISDDILKNHSEVISQFGSDLLAGNREIEKILQSLSKEFSASTESFGATIKSLEEIDASAKRVAETVGGDLSDIMRNAVDRASEVQSSLDSIHQLAIAERRNRGNIVSGVFSRMFMK